MQPIIYDRWEDLGCKWETGDELPEDYNLFVTCDHIAALFQNHWYEVQDRNIISAASDYGPVHQIEYPPHQDIRRWLPMQSLEGLGYRDLYMPARLDQEKCLASHEYSIRSYSWTHSTFHELPECWNQWYCTNSEIHNINIPFGIDQESWAYIQKYKDIPKLDRVFCCWSHNTNERASYSRMLRGAGGFVFFDELDKEQFIYELSSSKYCMCPEGNGKDSYRVLQALYAGVIPLLIKNKWSPYRDLTGEINIEDLKITVGKQTDWNIIDFDYWRNKIDPHSRQA